MKPIIYSFFAILLTSCAKAGQLATSDLPAFLADDKAAAHVLVSGIVVYIAIMAIRRGAHRNES